ncbi:hypothetical protein EU803_09055 [Loktanella sp. IMCC34160]|uniref:hypothetical protein n=1 Tax=Rhodobacterales TaxID=204455 RepID=UPI00101D7EED|nr:hypothetical protein [Loktanella sp. IMCC34160]RYG91236.1 hypothetical protein EU803_09055 [Loktanella sp. IMCC34160]
MERHIIDKHRDLQDGPRLREYVRMERESAPSAASRTLQQKPRAERSARQVKEFLRIERGQTA